MLLGTGRAAGFAGARESHTQMQSYFTFQRGKYMDKSILAVLKFHTGSLVLKDGTSILVARTVAQG